jgi:hypothetical protein
MYPTVITTSEIRSPCGGCRSHHTVQQYTSTVTRIFRRSVSESLRYVRSDILTEIVIKSPAFCDKYHRRPQALFAVCFMLVFCLVYSSILKMKATCSSEMSIDFQQTTWWYIPPSPKTLQSLCCLRKCFFFLSISHSFWMTQEFVLHKVYIVIVSEKSTPPASARPYNELHATAFVFIFKT